MGKKLLDEIWGGKGRDQEAKEQESEMAVMGKSCE